jgi:hypothetical protein
MAESTPEGNIKGSKNKPGTLPSTAGGFHRPPTADELAHSQDISGPDPADEGGKSAENV